MGSWAYFDPEVSVDNSSCKDCTLVKVDSMNKPGILLEVVQILTDLDLIITKAYISSDGGWFMDVFHVTDQQGQKISDNRTIEQIEKSPHQRCCCEVWTHNRRIACVLYVNDDTTNRAVDDASRLSSMEEQLKNIFRGCGNDDDNVAHTSLSVGSTHVDRRLHQLLFADRDYEGAAEPIVLLNQRPKLMFDIVCTLTDMQYVVFHATISSEGPYASQEYYIRHMDGCTLETEGETEKVIKCLEAAIRRRVSEGLSLELCAKDRVGLLSEVTSSAKNGLSVTRAGVTTVGEQAMNVFYVSDASGKPVDAKTIEELRKEIGETMRLNVKKAPTNAKALEASGWAKTSFFFGSLLEKFLT
ncbi:hypothetical protein DH2020_034265 [Rehmannia glutinosa]|uniref:ACT domain-containing protein ACR n=1 Tax=Rehmannia glutinosa TaxID=99300 RepID=A0ABR0VAB9_REHGL